MAPIYDTDLAQERWSQAEWRSYELWEKVERRERRKRRAWIAAAAAVFVVLSSVPVLMDRSPAWRSQAAVRKLAQEINRIKRDASLEHAAYRIRLLTQQTGLKFQVEKASSCSDPKPEWVRSDSLLGGASDGDFRFLTKAEGEKVAVPGLADSFCYDYLSGSGAVIAGDPVVGMGVIPVKDLAEGRTDRMSILALAGPSAEISFE